MRDDWDYEEVDLYEDEPAEPSRVDPDGLTGTDPARVVRVIVSPRAEVLAVRLAEQWERAVDPRSLGTSVLAAMNNATAQAMAYAIEHPPALAEQPAAPATTEHISPQDTIRLLDAVFADLDAFTRDFAAVSEQQVHAESRGGHVRGTAQAGQVNTLSVDADWAAVVRAPEIESELFEVLRELRKRSTPRNQAPQSPAIAELAALLSDPDTLLRRVGPTS